jgi:hypothetical protein
MRGLAQVIVVLVTLTWMGGLMAAERVPEKPIQLEVSTKYEGANSIAVLKWRDMSDNELGFEVLRSDNSGEFRVVGMVGANTTGYQDKVGKYVTGGFSYKVRAFNQAGRSEDSNVASVWF